MRIAYRTVALLVALGVVFQASVIAFGMFGLFVALDGGAIVTAGTTAPNPGFDLHLGVGYSVLPALALLLLIVSFFARVRRGVLWAALVLAAVVVQVLLGGFAHELPAVGLLHGVGAFVVLALALTAAWASRRTRPAAAAEVGDASTARPVERA